MTEDEKDKQQCRIIDRILQVEDMDILENIQTVINQRRQRIKEKQ